MARKPLRTLAAVCSKLEDMIVGSDAPAIYFSALYDNKTPFDVVSDKIGEIAKHHKKIVGWIGLDNSTDTRLGVVIYRDEQARLTDEKRGIKYDRYCF